MNLVLIEWMDAMASDSGWHTKEELDKFKVKNCIVKQVGYLIGDEENYTVIVDSYTNEGSYGTITLIPNGWIKSITCIKEE